MKFNTLMLIKAAVCLVLGLLILFFPVFTYSLFGITLSEPGTFAAREYGASLMGNFFLTWIARSAGESIARRGILWGLFIYDAIGVVITLMALLGGILNPLGWGIALIYLFFALGFGYFLIRSPQP